MQNNCGLWHNQGQTISVYLFMHMGKKVKAVMLSKGMNAKTLARKLGTRERAVRYLFNRQFTTVDKLLKISEALEHNFFTYYVQDDPAFDTTGLENTIAKLKQQNNVLKLENTILQRELNLLKEIMSKR